MSTFAEEMSSSAMILGFPFHMQSCTCMLKTVFIQGLSSAASLVLIDELGRGTSPREGLGISHAIAECLIRTKVCEFSHPFYRELTAYVYQASVFFATYVLCCDCF